MNVLPLHEATTMTQMTPSFPIPASLQDLERAPYNLLPYPVDFADGDEAARADSFDGLVHLLEQSNRTLMNAGLALFEPTLDDEIWMDEERIQALYTLVRKSSSLAPTTRGRLVSALCQAVHALSSILSTVDESETTCIDGDADPSSKQVVMPQTFRDAFACHVYMLFSIMFFTESEAKIAKGVNANKLNSSTKRTENNTDLSDAGASRVACAKAMLAAAQSMGRNRSRLWQRGVPDEAVVALPCRIAYQMLESATGVVARKAASADEALGMIAATVDSAESLLGTIVAALMDLLHSFEHVAALVAELCCMTTDSKNRLAVELLREIGRLDTAGSVAGNDAGGKASGLKNVASFISEIAAVRPRVVLSHISLVLPHLNSEPYGLRSAIVTAVGHILEYITRTESDEQDGNGHIEREAIADDIGKLNLSKSRNSLLDVLTERVHDASSFTRAAVLKVLISLTQHGSLPVERVKPVTAIAIDRLQDKTVMVRRSAMQLLTSLLENNPFMGCLDPEPYKRKLSDLYRFIQSHLPTDIKEAYEASVDEAGEDADTNTLRQLEQAALRAALAESDSTNDSEELSEQENEFRSKARALKFAQSALDFIVQFENAQQTFQGMLLSATTSDVTEALRFFVRARHFKLPCAVTGVKQALALMWSTEPTIKEEVLKAFVEVFIAVPGTEGKEPLPDNEIAHNLLLLAGRASVSELASIEEALVCIVKVEGIPADVFLILWSIASKASGEARAAAMLVLSMAASADRGIVDSASRLRLLLEAGLGEYTEEHRDWKTARSAACALQRVSRVHSDKTSAKFIVLEQISERLCAVARGDWCVDGNTRDTQTWFSAAEQAIDALFVICPEPELACVDIIRGMETVTFESADGKLASTCHSLRLSRFFFVLGHVALKLLVYTESLSGSVRRANASKSLKIQEQVDVEKAKKQGSPSSQSSDGEDAIEAELGIAAEMEAENERKVAEISEKEIVGRGLIGLFGPLLVRVVGNEAGVFSSEMLMQSATLAFCKLMCISSSFCEKHLPLLFTALANAPSQDTTLRANTVVALGDLAFRFPNEVEPYTPRLYACLRDSSTKVRRHTLMVLTHLILNDMVKVKGQVCEIAMCLQDEDARIRDMSRLLFHELSKRSNNPIYNLLPDIISQLSQMSIRKENFRSIMSFLLGFIKKERQNDMLVEKLCYRFPNCTSISQKADIAFCISQLKMNQRTIKCLNDLFKLYKDALFDDDIKKSFFSVAAKAKKFSKPEMKECLEEWEAKLVSHAESGLENELAGQKAERAKAKATKRAVRKRTKNRHATVESHSDDDGSFAFAFDKEDTSNKENSTVHQKVVSSQKEKLPREKQKVQTAA